MYFPEDNLGSKDDKVGTQNKLNGFGVSNLVIEMATSDDGLGIFVHDLHSFLLLIKPNQTDEEFLRAIILAISLLDGGNCQVQKSFFDFFESKKAEPFFQKVCSLSSLFVVITI